MATHQGFETLSSAIGDATNYTRWILAAFGPHIGHSLVEIGLGQSNYIDFLPQLSGYTGIDIDAAVLAHAQSLHPERHYVLGDLDDAALPQKLAQTYDNVLCLNVLQYVHNESSAIRNMLAMLAPQGSILLLVPAMKCLMGHMDVLAGHRYRYEPSDIRRYVNEAGGRLVHMEYFNPIGAIGWWVNNHRQHDSLEDDSVSAQIRLFDRYVVPLSRLANPLTKRFFGQSLLCVIQK